jgi:hypothetical protein
LCQAFVIGSPAKIVAWVGQDCALNARNVAQLGDLENTLDTRDASGELRSNAGFPHFHSAQYETHPSSAKNPTHPWKISGHGAPARLFPTLPQCYLNADGLRTSPD